MNNLILIISLIVIFVIFYIWGKQIHKKYLHIINGIRNEEFVDSATCPPELPLGPTTVVAYNDDIAYSNKGTGKGKGKEGKNGNKVNKEPWLHHPVNGSLELDPKVTFKNAYYYEFDNLKYESGLKIALVVPCQLMADAVTTGNWGEEIDPATATSLTTPEAIDAYNGCITYVYQKINGASSMVLPGAASEENPKPNIQVVHDILKWFKIHTSTPDMFLIDMELVLYRENKVHGKHVHVTCTAKKSSDKTGWVVNVVAVEVLGIVPEDNIALFPIVPSNPFGIDQLDVSEDTNRSSREDYVIKDAANKVLANEHATTWAGVILTTQKMNKYNTDKNRQKTNISDMY